MSIIQPTRSVIINGVDVSNDVLDVQAMDMSLDHGMPSVQITLANIGGTYATLWPPFGETGLYYPGTISFNGVPIMQFRFEGLDPELAKKNQIVVDGLVVGATPLQKQYMSQLWAQRKADDIISDVVNWADSSHQWGDALTQVTYTSPGTGETVNYQANREYCHDIIRKILEKENWTGTLRATSSTAAALDIFPVNDATHQHTSILQAGDLFMSGKSPRDVKESANVLELTGGKSTQEPSDGDAWTETFLQMWHPNTSCTLQSVTNPVSCGKSALAAWVPDIIIPVEIELDLREALGGEYFNAVTRQLSLVSFKLAVSSNMGWNTFQVKLAFVDSNGAVIVGNEVLTGPQKANSYLDMIFNASPTSSIAGGGSLTLASGEGDFTLESGESFDWTQLAKVRLRFQIQVGTETHTPLTYYVDCFHMVQNYTPQVRVIDAARVAQYDPRMQSIDAPEYTEYADLNAYGVQLAQASSTPTYSVDLTFHFDPTTELLKAGWSVRFNLPNFGIGTNVWWRLLEVEWKWNSKDGLTVRLIAIPASTGSADYTHNLSSRVWTRDRAGLDKNIIEAIDTHRKLKREEREVECVPAA